MNGKKLPDGDGTTTIITKNALGEDNGKQVVASKEQVELLIQHIKHDLNTNYKDMKDLRNPIRNIEQKLLSSKYTGFLVGNQCIDFQKQDGITEIEEAIMANTVERKLNDLLLQDESNGKLTICRKPIYGTYVLLLVVFLSVLLSQYTLSLLSFSVSQLSFYPFSVLFLLFWFLCTVVSAVSNFTNFLDLFRKTIRNLEVGIPCIILGRSNTVQHSYRWTKLLIDLLQEEDGIDPGMVVYLSCSLEDIKYITQTCKDYTGNLYATCSRELAASIKSGYPNTVASTGGPNTLVTWNIKDATTGEDENKKRKVDVGSSWTDEIQNAIRCSATIESSGQCTALRHVVVPPDTTDDQIQSLFDTTQSIPNASKALEESLFDGVFAKHKGSVEPPTVSSTSNGDGGYTRHPTADAFYTIRDGEFPSTDKDLPEYWRKVVVDVSRVDVYSPGKLDELASWLNTHQPISLAINGPTKSEALDIGLQLFEKTGLVVNTIGTKELPALTCQARPQEAEVFGEFPPRRLLQTYTKFPVIVPSSTPSYDASYRATFLTEQGTKVPSNDGAVSPLMKDISDDTVRGYCVTLWEYLQDATRENPKRGFGSVRTAMWGIQRQPLGTTTYLRCKSGSATWDAIAPYVILFYGTNAKDQLQVSLPKGPLVEVCQRHGISHLVESDEDFSSRKLGAGDNVVNVEGETAATEMPMVGQFVSRLFPVGHIKSTKPNDEEFVARVQACKKWLKTTG